MLELRRIKHACRSSEENWRAIQAELAAVFDTNRSLEEIRKKWTDIKYAAKEVARFRRE